MRPLLGAALAAMVGSFGAGFATPIRYDEASPYRPDRWGNPVHDRRRSAYEPIVDSTPLTKREKRKQRRGQ